MHRAHLELARDYISAGLLDRAERLLLDLVRESPEQKPASLRHLLEIYQSEREWQLAIDAASELLPRKSLLGPPASQRGDLSGGEEGQAVATVLSHLYCEQAAQRIDRGELDAALKLLTHAVNHDSRCVRASLMRGQVEHERGNYKEAIQALHKVSQQEPGQVVETIALLRQCHRDSGSQKSLLSYLRGCLDKHWSPALVMAMAQELQTRGDAKKAEAFLARELEQKPSLLALSALIDIQGGGTDSDAERDRSKLLKEVVASLSSVQPTYQCSHCGFSGRLLHWLCPGCKHWGTMKTIQGGNYG